MSVAQSWRRRQSQEEKLERVRHPRPLRSSDATGTTGKNDICPNEGFTISRPYRAPCSRSIDPGLRPGLVYPTLSGWFASRLGVQWQLSMFRDVRLQARSWVRIPPPFASKVGRMQDRWRSSTDSPTSRRCIGNVEGSCEEESYTPFLHPLSSVGMSPPAAALAGWTRSLENG